MKVTKENLKKFRNDFETSMRDLEEKYGIQISMGNISYRDSQFSAKITALNLDAGREEEKEPGTSDDARQLAWNIGCRKNPLLKPEYLGKIIMIRGVQFMVDGFNPSAKKNCVFIKRLSDDKMFVTSPQDIAYNL